MNYLNVFERFELKYVITAEQMNCLRKAIKEKTRPDEYGKSTVCNIYYDTLNHFLIRNSIEKPVFKEKLRMRSYGVPSTNNGVFIELKKKYKSIVYKRRVSMSYPEAVAYLNENKKPSSDSQIIREIDRFKTFYYDLYPAMFISSDRTALYGCDNAGLRITFDENILWRTEEPHLHKGAWGNRLLPDDSVIMEIKLNNALPLWLVNLLSQFKIYPGSFSKYGTAYAKAVKNNILSVNGEPNYA